MFSKLLIKKFIKNFQNKEDRKVRKSYGYLAGIVGVIINITLFVIKFSVGIFTKSIAISADAFNNLSDSASSLITILGFKLASKPADKEHPFGHGRIEYISALIVSFFVLLVGVEFTKSSFSKIINPTTINFSMISFLLMLLSIFIKLWLGYFYRTLSYDINSSTLKASSKDSFADVITSSVVAFSLISSKFFTFPIDGYIGIVVSLFIIYSGISLIKETLDPLLGESPDPDLVKDIKNLMLKYDGIKGTHDLIVHNYGPGRCIASIHAEVPSNAPIVHIHEIIDKAEREISEELGVLLVIHMDPINTDCKEIQSTKEFIESILKKYDNIHSMHDFRVVGEGEVKNIIFDIVVKYNKDFSKEDEKDLIDKIVKDIKIKHPNYNAIITIDKDFLGVY
ncbi:cation diffusion facilitator family transporter [Hathewaya histolytica]|uniref:Cobalt-zinc-cadmium resistance protein czcD n=1 Tax=Hathewaya histolytica TaxID=1498 RepID=A0A4U9R821_HATHI|nr:cation diffusion facilitator family transporter [Hathewaya histolytica]VTQ84840.1 cobalt-zinc-cadmium resistance protein czcD [Hathewaya histolytica]